MTRTLYSDSTARENLYHGEPPTKWGKVRTYEVPAMDQGVYLFRCDVHPAVMTGVLNVV